MKSDQPADGEWVIASFSNCPDRFYWQREGDVWVDQHGCRRTWDQLVDPIDSLEPEWCDGCGRPLGVGHFGEH